jgi:toxin ParE1/3/4
LNYRLAAAAEADLDSIARFTVKNFGPAQANSYRALILRALASIAENPLRPSSQAHDDARPRLRSFRIALAGARQSMASHALWYLEPAPGADTVFVLRILHERMDPELHLGVGGDQ